MALNLFVNFLRVVVNFPNVFYPLQNHSFFTLTHALILGNIISNCICAAKVRFFFYSPEGKVKVAGAVDNISHVLAFSLGFRHEF